MKLPQKVGIVLNQIFFKTTPSFANKKIATLKLIDAYNAEVKTEN